MSGQLSKTQQMPDAVVGPNFLAGTDDLGLDAQMKRKIVEKALQWSKWYAEMQGDGASKEGLLFGHMNHRMDRMEDKLDHTAERMEKKIDKTAAQMGTALRFCQEGRDKRIRRLQICLLSLALIVGALAWKGPKALEAVTALIWKLALG
jgi:hypothetical protein